MAVQEWCISAVFCYLDEELVPRQWQEGLIYFRKGIKRTRVIIEVLHY